MAVGLAFRPHPCEPGLTGDGPATCDGAGGRRGGRVGRSGQGRPGDAQREAAWVAAAHGWLGEHRLGAEDRRAALDAGRLVRCQRHDVVLRSRDDAIAYLVQGAATARSLSTSGASTVLRILAPGDTWGWAGALGQVDIHAEVEAVLDSIALVIPGHALRELVRQRPAIARGCLQEMAAQLADLQNETARFHNTSTTERVVHRLVQLAEFWGRRREGAIEITLRLTQEDLASWARASRESTTKILHELRSSGVITTGRREITVLDLDRLRGRSTATPEEIDLRDPAQEYAASRGGPGGGTHSWR
jgi:CRP/FNR family transcriptional regulator, cyclic AMP receptor protein